MIRLLISAVVLGLFGGCATPGGAPRELRTVEKVDLPRYMGDWFVIAHIPYFLERGKVATLDRYALRPDGKLTNTFVFRKGSLDAPEQRWDGVAEVVNTVTNAEWRVQFVWPLSSKYLVLELDPEYRWAVVSSGDGDLVWILSRQRQLDDAVYQNLLGKIRARGLDAGKLTKVLQPTS